MDLKEKYEGLFMAMSKAPMASFLEKVMDGLRQEQRSRLIIEQLSYNRYSPEIDTLEAFMCVAPIEKNQWVWAYVERNSKEATVEEHFFVSSANGKQLLGSLRACLEYYAG